jgi:hypothetical protein
MSIHFGILILSLIRERQIVLSLIRERQNALSLIRERQKIILTLQCQITY